VHLNQRCQIPRVTEVVRILTARQAGAVGRFDRNNANGLFTAQFSADKRKGKASKIASAPGTANHHVRVIVGHLHLA
jgi:hypothetical protein